MPAYGIEIKVDPSAAVSGARRVQQELNNTGTAADNVGKLIKRAMAFTGVALGVNQLRQMADTYTDMQNRLRGVTSGQEQLDAVTERLFATANKTRNAFDATVEMYAKVALATKELGRTQAETLDFTESLNQAVILSGASTQEASAGIRQLSQGMASGTLRGDELNSVLEQIPVVADVIAKGLNITRGELRAMGADGKISADIILDAFSKARGELAERFAKTVPTLSQSFQVLSNVVLKYVGDLNEGIGVTARLSKFVIAIADNIDTLARAAAAAGSVIAVQFVQRGIKSAIAGVRALTIAIASNPIGAVAVALTATVAALVAFSDKIALSADGFVTLRDYGVAAFQLIKEYAIPVYELLSTGITEAIDWVIQGVANMGVSFGEVVNVVKTVVNQTIGFWYGFFKVQQLIFRKIREVMMGAFGSETAREIMENFKLVLGFLVEEFQKFGRLVLTILDKVGLASVELGALIGIEIPAPKIPKGIADFGAEVRDTFMAEFGRDFIGEFAGIVSPAIESLQKRARELSDTRRQAAQVEADAQKKAAESLNRVISPAREKINKDLIEYLDNLKAEGNALRLSSAEREIAIGLLEAENKLKDKFDRGPIEALLRENQLLQTRANIMDAILAPITEYKDTQAALNQLLKDGAISAAQYNAALAQTQIVSDLAGVRAELPGTAFGAELQQLQDAQNSRLEIIRQAKEAQLITEQEYLALSLEANKKYNQDVLEAETNRFRGQLQNGQEIFGSLSKIAQSYAGEQSGLYKTLFRASKAFAIADSTVKIYAGIADAADNPWPKNLAAMASVASATAGLVGQIQATDLQGFQNGGDFRVGGAGGTDSQLVAFRATPNETVSVRTPGQANRDQKAMPAQAEQQPINVVNVVDPGLLDSYMNTPAGERVFVNAIRRNSSQIARYIK